jgi:excinuclease ABC subunit A
MRALRKLQSAGHSLLVIEHNLDVIRASDWIVDLGPEGGEAGGEVVCVGTPDDVKAHPSSHTGLALREYEHALGLGAAVRAEEGQPLQALLRAQRQAARVAAGGADNHIRIVNAREHNLKSLNVDIPRGKFNVVTGVSGSGKSTLAFDILFNEGQRRYLESLNAYARSIVQPAGRPEVDAVYGIPPTVAIEQRLSRGGRKSTVATTTEVWHFLRLLWVKLGLQHCVHDGAPVKAQSAESIAAQLLRDHRGQHVGLLAPLVINRKGVYTDLAKWAKARGHTHLRVDGEFLSLSPFPRIDRFKEHTIELPVGSIVVSAETEPELRALLSKTLELGRGVLHLLHPLDGLAAAMDRDSGTGVGIGDVKVFSTKRACPQCGTSYAELDPRLFSYNSKHGWCTGCVGTGLKLTREQRKAYDDSVRDDDNKGREQSFPAEEAEVEGLVDEPCSECGGARLNATSRGVTFEDKAIQDIARLSVFEARQWVDGLALEGRDADIARDVVVEIKSRLEFLADVGLGYLTLDRAAPTLSGGEAQRIRLAAQLGSNLQGVCYVLDEPTIGLHPRDNGVLLGALAKLSAAGNTLVVVEHDEDTIRRAEHLIDIGPGAGKRGGTLVAQGTVADLSAQSSSLTGRLLAHPLATRCSPRREVDAALPALWVRKATLHNLQGVDLWVPMGRLVAVTGVSGSGKSTLARDVLLANVAAVVGMKASKEGRDALAAGKLPKLAGCAGLSGFEAIDRVLEVDQTPIGKTPRSCPATYIGFWDSIRKLFTETLEARARGYGSARFSASTPATAAARAAKARA